MTININELTLGQVKELGSILNTNQAVTGLNDMIGQKVIIRTYAAGNWFGTLAAKSGDEIYLTTARRMWQWKAAESISLSACALHGIDQPNSRIVAPVEKVWLQAIEIIPCTAKAVVSIEGAPHAEAR